MFHKIIVARYQGFCMGVERAINIAQETARNRVANEKVTILNEIVHNEAVVERLRREGVEQAVCVDDVDSGTLIVSAHGVAPAVVEAAIRKGLRVVDATCPLVTRIYSIIKRAIAQDYYVIHCGDPHHDETAGIVGHATDRITVVADPQELAGLPDWNQRKLGLTVQTTAHAKEFEDIQRLARQKWPHIEVFNTICNATTRRQDAILQLASHVDMILVVGSTRSANSIRLVRIAQAACGRGELIGSSDDIKDEWFSENDSLASIGISSGASTPQFLVETVIDRLIDMSGGSAEVVRPPRTLMP